MKNNLWHEDYPSPIREIFGAALEGRAAIVLEGNTNDRLICLEKKVLPMSLNNALFYVASQHDYHCGEFSLTSGFTSITPPDSKARGKAFPQPHGDPGDNVAQYLTQFISSLQNSDFKRVLILNGADFISPEIEPAMMSPDQIRTLSILIETGLSDSFRRSGNIIILKALQGSANRSLLRSGAFRRISQPLPDEKMRLEFASHLFKQGKGFAKPAEDISLEEFARLTNGTRLVDIEGISKRRYIEESTISKKDISGIKQKSIEDTSQGQLGVIVPSKTMDDIVGLDHIKRSLEYQAKLAREGSPSMPGMILEMGVPGVGKSHLAEAYANKLGWTLLEWRNVRSKWVGESEARTEQALDIIRQNAPCLVWSDEVDQSIGGRSTNAGDGGVDARILAQILAATGDSVIRGKVQWLMATNRPDILDTAILDRAGEKLIFLPPSKNDREKLFSHLARQQKRELAPELNLKDLAGAPNLGMASVRNLQEIIQYAGAIADMRADTINTPISEDELRKAVNEFNPGDTMENEYIALKCIEMVRFIGQMPWIGPDGKLIKDYEYPPYLSGIADTATGRIDSQKLAKKIREIERLRAHQHMMR